MPKPIIITSLGSKKRGQVRALRDLCKYLQYRDGSLRREAYLSPEHHYPDGVSDLVKPQHRNTRWVDRGMGETYKQIANRAFDWQGRYLLARTWVISPDPELMKHLPEKQRFEVVSRVTEHTVERWYSDNGWGQADYSYVVHDKQRAADGEQMVHAHVITPATVPVDEIDEYGRIDHRVTRAHIHDLHLTAAECFEHELGRVLGQDKAQEIIEERDARLERERSAGKDQLERFHNLRALADVLRLLDTQKKEREAKKKHKQRKRDSRQMQAELRIYRRYLTEDRRKRREADRLRIAAVRQQEHEAELGRERARHEARVDGIIERGRRVPTHADLHEQEEAMRRDLQIYFASLLARQEREQSIGREYQGREIER